MNHTPLSLTFDYALFEELYGAQPQAITWMKPILGADGKTIIDFEYAYSNQQGLSYLNLTPAQHNGLRLSVSPTLNDELRESIHNEMEIVYLSGQASQTN